MARLIRANRRDSQPLRGNPTSPLAGTENLQLADAISQLVDTIQRIAAREQSARECDFRRASLLAIPIAQQLVGDAVRETPNSLVKLLMPMVNQLRGSSILEIKAHPRDAAALTQALASHPTASTQLTVTPDSTLSRGSLVVHGLGGAMDGRVETRLKLIKQAMDNAAEQPRATSS